MVEIKKIKLDDLNAFGIKVDLPKALGIELGDKGRKAMKGIMMSG